MSYPEQINLPFNFSFIKESFTLRYLTENEPTEQGYWAIIQGNSVVLLTKDDDTLALPEGRLPECLKPLQEPLCIGFWHGKPLRACTASNKIAIELPLIAEQFNATEQRLDFQTLTLAGLAKQILHWELQSRHCSRCGAEMERIPDSWGKRCGCGAQHFPHIHPCAIVLVKRGNQVLLTRKSEWPPGRYSLVAGFLDFGESLEECAIREVKEETGIEIENVRYVGSQNWPFPAQLMAGFVADYVAGEIAVDTRELEDARWFPVDDLPLLPPRRSIARYIIDNFV
jgi:NAD+ diphosphatase